MAFPGAVSFDDLPASIVSAVAWGRGWTIDVTWERDAPGELRIRPPVLITDAQELGRARSWLVRSPWVLRYAVADAWWPRCPRCSDEPITRPAEAVMCACGPAGGQRMTARVGHVLYACRTCHQRVIHPPLGPGCAEPSEAAG